MFGFILISGHFVVHSKEMVCETWVTPESTTYMIDITISGQHTLEALISCSNFPPGQYITGIEKFAGEDN